jgi:hypothetical protein
MSIATKADDSGAPFGPPFVYPDPPPPHQLTPEELASQARVAQAAANVKKNPPKVTPAVLNIIGDQPDDVKAQVGGVLKQMHFMLENAANGTKTRLDT